MSLLPASFVVLGGHRERSKSGRDNDRKRNHPGPLRPLRRGAAAPARQFLAARAAGRALDCRFEELSIEAGMIRGKDNRQTSDLAELIADEDNQPRPCR